MTQVWVWVFSTIAAQEEKKRKLMVNGRKISHCVAGYKRVLLNGKGKLFLGSKTKSKTYPAMVA